MNNVRMRPALPGWLAPAVLAGLSVLITARIWGSTAGAGGGAGAASAAAGEVPVLYANPDQESPVTGGPDDLMVLVGLNLAAGDSVVYEAADASGVSRAPPPVKISASTAQRGAVPIVDASNAPVALTIRLPEQLSADRSYRLWVRSPEGRWSNGVMFNDARPKWLSPGFGFETQASAGLPRYLKVIGRNLAPMSGVATRVRLTGPETIERAARSAGDGHAALDRFVAQIDLPARMRRGRYAVSVSRDGHSWVRLPGQTFVVEPDPTRMPEFFVGDPRFGGCKPDDGFDDTACVGRALEQAKKAGGGAVRFGAGIWSVTGGSIVPQSVDLIGDGADTTVVLRPGGDGSAGPAFTLLGGNRVQGIHFRDEGRIGPDSPAAPMLRLGPSYDDPQTAVLLPSRRVDDIVITRNIFERAHPGVSAGGLPIGRLFITHNEFGAYDFGLIVRGDRFNVRDRFQISDAVITDNLFEPGAYLDLPARQGAIASQLGASLRMDFSNNKADGASRRFLDAHDAGGWRAAFFWNLTGQNEFLLVSRNLATCTGDKDGDGEAIAFDNDGNTFGFGRAVDVVDAGAAGVTVGSLLAGTQSGRAVGADYYVGHDVQVVAGAGIGQVRRILAYQEDPADLRVHFDVSPAWDVPPQKGSRVIVGRQFRQAYIVDNLVDERRPLCQKSNRTNEKAGVIGLWAQTAGTVIEGNRQYDSDGILTNQNYNAEAGNCADCGFGSFVQSFFEIRGNLIDGEYDWDSDCSHSGIYIANSAAPVAGSRPPTMNFGGSVSHNMIRRADALRGGAISVPLTWHQGPPPHDWPVINNLLIFGNTITDLDGPPPRHRCDDPQSTRIGINLYQAQMVHSTILYGNQCRHVATPVHDGGLHTHLLCKPDDVDSCECAAAR